MYNRNFHTFIGILDKKNLKFWNFLSFKKYVLIYIHFLTNVSFIIFLNEYTVLTNYSQKVLFQNSPYNFFLSFPTKSLSKSFHFSLFFHFWATIQHIKTNGVELVFKKTKLKMTRVPNFKDTIFTMTMYNLHTRTFIVCGQNIFKKSTECLSK